MNSGKQRGSSDQVERYFGTRRRVCRSSLRLRRYSLGLLCLIGMLLLVGPRTAAAQGCGFGPNQGEPDSSLIMPLVASEGYVSYFAISNVGASDGSEELGTFPSPVPILWEFYDESGELLVDVERYVLGEGGTDIVDPRDVRSKDVTGSLGPKTDLAGRRGFVVVSSYDDEPRLLGNFTVAQIATEAAWGASAAGVGVNGVLVPGDVALGTTFAIDSLEDDLLIVIGVDDLGFVPTSLTFGFSPEPGEELLDFKLALYTNRVFNPDIDEVSVDLSASVYLTRLGDALPDTDGSIPGTISIAPTSSEMTLLGFYGQAVGPFGGGQTLRMVAGE